METMIPLKDVIELTLSSQVDTAEKVPLSKAIEMILKSGLANKAAPIAGLIQRFGIRQAPEKRYYAELEEG